MQVYSRLTKDFAFLIFLNYNRAQHIFPHSFGAVILYEKNPKEEQTGKSIEVETNA